ncbi:MAG: hypothetical protein O3A13_15480, partial [Proteobacteria bacterium]|nr:hypothetical protein [Pseudomonadota bacterium]
DRTTQPGRRLISSAYTRFDHSSWNTRRAATEISDELKKVIDDAIQSSPNLTTDLHDRLVEEILRLSDEN